MTLVSADPPHSVQAILSRAPDEPVIGTHQNRKPMKPAITLVEIDYGETQLPIRATHVALPPRTHREIFNAPERATVHGGAGVRAEAMRVALEQTHTFFLDQELGRIRCVFGNLVPVADIQIADADKVVGEFARSRIRASVPLFIEWHSQGRRATRGPPHDNECVSGA